MKIWLIRILGFAIGAIAALAFEVVIIFLMGYLLSSELEPRGTGWIIIPIIVGIGIAKISPSLFSEIPLFKKYLINLFRLTSIINRLIIIVPLFWIFTVGMYCFIFEPYGRWNFNYYHMLKVMLFPSFVFVIAIIVYKKFLFNNTPSDT